MHILYLPKVTHPNVNPFSYPLFRVVPELRLWVTLSSCVPTYPCSHTFYHSQNHLSWWPTTVPGYAMFRHICLCWYMFCLSVWGHTPLPYLGDSNSIWNVFLEAFSHSTGRASPLCFYKDSVTAPSCSHLSSPLVRGHLQKRSEQGSFVFISRLSTDPSLEKYLTPVLLSKGINTWVN